jgi:hypothetical protein
MMHVRLSSGDLTEWPEADRRSEEDRSDEYTMESLRWKSKDLH